MSPRQRWVAAVLTLWGIPAILFWLGIGFFVNLSLRSAHEKQREKVSQVLDALSKNATDFLKNQLNAAFDELSQLPLDCGDFAERRTELEKRFPKGLFKFYLFDSSGHALVASKTSESLEIEKLFNFVRRSWHEEFPISSEYFSGTDRIFPDSEYCAERLRSQNGEMRMIGKKNRSSQFPTWSLYRWKPSIEKKVGGMLAFVVFGNLPDDYILRGGFAGTELRDCKAGLLFQKGTQMQYHGLPGQELKQVFEKYQQEPSKNFLFNNYIVEGRPIEDSAIFFVLAPLPDGPWKTILVTFILYFFLSFVIILKLYGVFVQQEPWRFSLGWKLAILFLWGVFFPIGAASSLALLYLQEKRGDILEENRKSAFQILDRIDQGYEKAITRREQFYHRISKGFSKGNLTTDQIGKLMKNHWERGNVDDYYLVSSQSKMILEEVAKRSGDFRSLLSFSLEKRMKILEVGMKKGNAPKISTVDCILGRISFDQLPQRQRKITRELSMKTISYIAKEGFSYVNALRGKVENVKQKNADLAVNSVMSDDVLILMKFMTLNLGRLIESPEASSAYAYSDVLTDPAGEASYVLTLNISYFNIQNDYLKREFSEERRMTSDYELRAYGNESAYSMDYPWDGGEQLIPINDRLEASKNPYLVCSPKLDGRDVEIVVRRPQNLRHIKLFHITPTEVLDRRLRVFQIQAVVFILLSCVFCFTLGHLLIKKFLVPLYALSAGVHALRNKQFEHRVQVFSKDEIGHLSLALNKTIEHMKGMEIASSLQANLFPPHRCQVGEFEIFGKNIMTQAIGGDYFDFIPLPEGRVAVVLGDVSGHGVSAALVAAMAKIGFSILCPIFRQNQVEILENINRLLLNLVKRQKMMSCMLGILDPVAETFTALNAGQCFPLLVVQSGETNFLRLISSPLGILKKGKFGSTVVSLVGKEPASQSFSGLVLYSDGLAEALVSPDVPLGYEAFAEIACNMMLPGYETQDRKK